MPPSFRADAKSGQTRVWLLDPGEPPLGASWTPNIMAYPNAGDECLSSLAEVLETGDVPARYFLSSKACSGILRRAEERGKELPGQLQAALKAAAAIDAMPIPPTA